MFVKKYWVWFFLMLLALDAISLAFHWFSAHFFLKILLVPVLISGLLAEKRASGEKYWRFIFAGLLLAWAGDTMLLFSKDKAIFFILGLICFLITHLTYILYFSRYNKGKWIWYLSHPLLSFLVILYGVSLFGYLLPGLKELVYPVAVYTIVICIMLLQALSAQPFLPAICNKYFVAGAISFVISDSLLALDKFHAPFFLSEPVIMITYGIAQLLIVKGAIQNTDKQVMKTGNGGPLPAA